MGFRDLYSYLSECLVAEREESMFSFPPDFSLTSFPFLAITDSRKQLTKMCLHLQTKTRFFFVRNGDQTSLSHTKMMRRCHLRDDDDVPSSTKTRCFISVDQFRRLIMVENGVWLTEKPRGRKDVVVAIVYDYRQCVRKNLREKYKFFKFRMERIC